MDLGGVDEDPVELFRDEPKDETDVLIEELIEQSGVQKAEVLERNAAHAGNYDMIAPLRVMLHAPEGRSEGVMNFQMMETVTDYLTSPSIKSSAGLPTTVAVSQQSIYVGTSRGILLQFDRSGEPFIGALGADTAGAERGRVTSLSTSSSPDGDWVLVGHENGSIALWDSSTRRIVKLMSGSHRSPVAHVAFFAERTHFVSADAHGMVILHNITRMLFAVIDETLTLLDASQGPIVALSTLLPGEDAHSTDDDELLAMATLDKTLIASRSPSPFRVRCRLPRPETVAVGALPYLAWRRAAPSIGRYRARPLDPILAIAWDHNVQLIQVFREDGERVEIVSVGRYESAAGLIGAAWMGERVLLLMNRRDQLRVLDAFSEVELDGMGVRHLRPVYHTRLKGPSGAGIEAFHSALYHSPPGHVYLLGVDGFAKVSALSWTERIQSLVDTGQWLDALALALEFYEGRAKGTVGLPRAASAVKEQTSERIVSLLLDYLDMALSPDVIPSDPLVDRSYFETLAGVCIDYCQTVGRADVLYQGVFQKFRQINRTDVLLELMEPYILNDKLRALRPEVMKAFVDHYRDNRWLVRVEQCILHLDIASLDIHQVVTLCRTERMYSALIHVFTTAIHDWVSPAEDMIAALHDPELSSDDRMVIAYKLLLYIACCLNGRLFPRGSADLIQQSELIPEEDLEDAQSSLLAFLFSSDLAHVQEGAHHPFSHLQLLLQLDATEFFSVLAKAMDNPHFSKIEYGMKTPDHQGIVDALTLVLVDFSSPPAIDLHARHSPSIQRNGQWPFPPSVVTQFFTFLTHYASLGTVVVSGELLLRVIADHISVLTTSYTPARESALLRLLQKTGTEPCDDHQLFSSVEAGKLHDVAAWLYRRRGQTEDVLAHLLAGASDAYCELGEAAADAAVIDGEANVLVDSPAERFLRRRREAFELVDTSLAQGKDLLGSTVLGHFAELVRLDVFAALRMVRGPLGGDHAAAVDSLSSDPLLQYRYLKALNGEGGDSLSLELWEVYFSRMCEFQPRSVYPLVKDGVPPNLSLDFCLRQCKRFDVTDASAQLLVLSGDASGAMDVMVDAARSHLRSLRDLLVSQSETVLSEEAEQKLNELKRLNSTGVALCVESKRTLDVNESDALWFRLLDLWLKPQRRLKLIGRSDPLADVMAALLEPLVQMVLHDAATHMSASTFLTKLLDEQGRQEFSELRDVIASMLDTYRFEASLLGTATHLLQSDAFRVYDNLLHRRRMGINSGTRSCVTCGRLLSEKGTDGIGLFACGHGYHGTCTPSEPGCPICTARGKKQVKASTAPSRVGGSANRETVRALRRHEERLMAEPSRLEQLADLDGGFMKRAVDPLPLAPKNRGPEKTVRARVKPGVMSLTPKFVGGM